MWLVDNIDPSFGDWFAGLCDGEGCFYIHKVTKEYPVPKRQFKVPKPRKRSSFRPSFALALRADDGPTLCAIRHGLGFGRVRKKYTGKSFRHPMQAFLVTKNEDLYKLVETLDLFQLQSKKATDYGHWREAVLVVRDEPATYDGARAKKLSAINDRLRKGREYKEATNEMPVL